MTSSASILILPTATDTSDLSQSLAPITEERASRTLYRISLLRRLRERVLTHPSLEDRLQLAMPSSELPVWWSSPRHDRELMLGAARHGVSRTEHSIFLDPEFTFQQSRTEYMVNQQAAAAAAAATASSTPGMPVSMKEEGGEEEESRLLGSEALCQSDSLAAPLGHPEGKGRGQAGWGWKKSRGRGPRHSKGGGKSRAGEGGGEGASDSDSDTDSDSSTSSRRSGSSEDSGDSDAERERGEGDSETCIVFG